MMLATSPPANRIIYIIYNKHADGDHPYDLALPPQRPLPRSLPLTDEFSLAYAKCEEFRPVWEALDSESVAYPFHKIGNFLY